MPILVTGTAGCGGYHNAKSLMERGHDVIGLDNLNPHDSVKLEAAGALPARGQAGISLPRFDIAELASRITDAGFARFVDRYRSYYGVRALNAAPRRLA